MFDIDSIIYPTDVPYRWIVDNLHGKDEKWDKLRNKHEISKAVAEPISGAGFLSNVLRVKFFFGDKDRVFNVILKAPTIEKVKLFKEGDEVTSFEDSLLFFHNQEIEFYVSFARHCDVIYFPKMYAFIKSDKPNRIHGRILTEDVGHLGVLPNVLEGMSLQKCEEVIKALAKFHAFTCCFLNSELILRIHKINDQRLDYEVNEKLYQLDPFFDQNREDIQKLSDNHRSPVPDAHFKFNVPPFMAHGDCWANNMFFERNLDGSCGEKLFTFFDWQVPKIGTGLSDLSRFLVTSAKYEVLEEHLDHLLEVYHQTLEENMKRRGRKVPYDLEKCKAMFRYEFPNEYLFALLVLPLLLQHSEDDKIKSGVIRRMQAGFHYAKDCAKELGTL